MTKRWYIVHAYSNSENKVAATIQEKAESLGLGHLFGDIVVPKEEVVEVKAGRKVSSERKFFPGYILVNVDLVDEAYHLIKNTPKVTGFLGADKKPVAISDAEVERVISQVRDGVGHSQSTVAFEIGEQVRVSDGPFASFSGLVEQVDEEKSRLKVAVLIFGRPTPVELEYSQVEKT